HLEQSGDLAAEVAYRARQVEEQRKFTSLVIDSLPVGVYVVDRDYRIQLWNRKRETGTQGLLKDDVLGRPVFDVLTRQSAADLKAEFDEVFARGEEQQIELEVTNQDERLAYRIRKIPMRLGDNGVSHVITIGEDVTHWRAVQQQIVQSEKLAAVGQLTAGIMHEINNPLATIGACVVAMEGRLPEIPPGAREILSDYLQIVEKEVERCTSILDGLLDFSRPQSRNKAPVDLNSLVEDALFLVQHHRGFRRLQVIRELDAGLPEVEGNGGQLLQVLLAIVLNAVDAMPDGGTLSVRTRGFGTRTVTEIRDTGQGIARADLSKIFEPFFTTKDPGKGTGLGLAICYGVVREHGGRIDVESDPGSGSLFRISLPVKS
ncbi:MAG: two-component system sensor histidine kinase NtrB, partial [Gemmatimonadales bacterium]